MTETAPEAPRRLSKGERTRARILDSAAELFARSGFLAVSLRDIAAHAGLTHAGVLHHFPGKEALLLDVLSRRDELDARRLFPAVLDPGEPEPEPAERLRLLLDVVDRNARTPGLVALYAKLSAEASDPDHPAHLYFVRRYQVLRRELTGLLAELFAAGGVREDPAAVAQQLLALMDGLQTQWLLEPDAVDMAEQVRAFLRRCGVAAEGRG
ncbi:TetR family transcriptional regulator [Streptomyces sp. SID2563]|uniref:TetR family transcriptional regulator n=1 Tax=Streptomyces sp. SID2563 TaxID=2690255 RepID=UPI00136F37AC|nr:TetR family transcriptional regulator [Streptomyces sp. SID2563]